MDQHQQTSRHLKSSLTSETSHWTSSSLILCLSSLPPDSRPWFPNEMQNWLLSEKMTLDHWATVQLFFSLAQVRCFWYCFCFRSGLVALFLKTSERGDSWSLTPASVHSLWSSPKCLNQLCLTVFSSLWSSLLLVHLFLPNFFLPVNFSLNMLWYSTLWTANHSVMTFCDLPSLWRVSVIVFWTIAKSAVFFIIVVSKNKRYPGFIL